MDKQQQTPTLIIEPGKSASHYWADLWRYRELFFFLSWRDILVRYKQTVIGIAWSILRPLLTMIVFTIIFGKFAKFPTEGGAPYPVLVFAAMLPWQLFANTLSETSNSLITNASMISKVYFPRLIIPASAVIVGLVDFIISFLILVLLMLWYGFIPDWQVLALPLFITLALATVTSVTLSPSWCNSDSMSHRLASVVRLFRNSGVCCTRSIRWSVSLMAFAGLSWVVIHNCTFRALLFRWY
jgi:lipopolysaccharide transport system permease protein